MPTIIDTQVVARQHPGLVRLLEEAPRLGHEHNWEGELAGARGAAKGCAIRVKARIGFYGDMTEGVGRAVNFPADMAASDAEFTLSGTLDLDAVAFQIWFAGAPFGHQPFACAGVLGSDGREMTGDWSVGCLFPDACDCDGGGGTFHLKRID